MNYFRITLLFALISLKISAYSLQKDSISDYYIRFEGDSILRSSIALEEVYIFGDLDFPNKTEKVRYLLLKRKTLKVSKLNLNHIYIFSL